MNRSNDVFLAFLIGAAAGGLTALLFAPEKGSETRKKLRKGIDDLYEKGSGYLEAAGDELRERADDLARAGQAREPRIE